MYLFYLTNIELSFSIKTFREIFWQMIPDAESNAKSQGQTVRSVGVQSWRPSREFVKKLSGVCGGPLCCARRSRLGDLNLEFHVSGAAMKTSELEKRISLHLCLSFLVACRILILPVLDSSAKQFYTKIV